MRDNTTLILCMNSNDYFFPFCKEEYNIHSVFYNQCDSKIFRVHEKFRMKNLLLLMGWKKTIFNYKKIIIFDSGWNKSITEFIKKYNEQCNIHLFFFNTISNDKHWQMLKDKNIDKFWTFDLGDVEKYHINYNSTMYTKRLIACMNKSEKESNDVVFVGNAKKREFIINYIGEECKKKKLRTDFNVIKSNDDYISYSDYLRRIANSRVILDVTNEGQMGLTLRFMEALFLSKKLITNNVDVKRYSFYNPQNIFIWGEDDIEYLSEFVFSPYFLQSEEEINYYDIGSWIKRFN